MNKLTLNDIFTFNQVSILVSRILRDDITIPDTLDELSYIHQAFWSIYNEELQLNFSLIAFADCCQAVLGDGLELDYIWTLEEVTSLMEYLKLFKRVIQNDGLRICKQRRELKQQLASHLENISFDTRDLAFISMDFQFDQFYLEAVPLDFFYKISEEIRIFIDDRITSQDGLMSYIFNIEETYESNLVVRLLISYSGQHDEMKKGLDRWKNEIEAIWLEATKGIGKVSYHDLDNPTKWLTQEIKDNNVYFLQKRQAIEEIVKHVLEREDSCTVSSIHDGYRKDSSFKFKYPNP